MGRLKEELLAVYRRLAFLHDESDRHRLATNSLRRRLDESEKTLESTRRSTQFDLDGWAKAYETISTQNSELRSQIDAYESATDTILDLIGAVIEEQDHLDHFHELFAIAEPVQPAPVTPKPKPSFCLSCGDKKDGWYLCDTCFDLDLDNSGTVFDELQDAWEAGARDFPRPGKNIKELYN